jgi:putative flippase GtrA
MRFLRFNGVGAIGFGVQIAVLAILMRAGVHYLLATAIAVELSVLNNFLWHERWTWRDRPATGRARLFRLGRFHVLNGIVSLAGNVAVTALLVSQFGIPPILANVIAVLVCGLVNFAASDRLVFVSGLRDLSG